MGGAAMKHDNDIKAPDGFLLGGERRVRAGGVILFQRGWWQLPEGFAQQGEYCWVHCTDSGAGDLEVAPPGYRDFYAAAHDRVTIRAPRTDRPDAKPGYRTAAHKAWQSPPKAAN
jgi:hypothetical protein